MKIKLMGIVNCTDDSFYEASATLGREGAMQELVESHIGAGADIIDFGACSTRPGSKPVSADTEWERLEPALRRFRKRFPDTPFSVDTFHSEVIRRVYDSFGPFMVNDISAGRLDEAMLPLVGRLGLRYVAMHSRGTPETMQSMCEYENVTDDICHFFREFAVQAEDAGIKDWIADPGFGFAKTIPQNLEMLENIDRFALPGHDLLIGISRKSFLYRPLGLTPEEALPATTEAHTKILNILSGKVPHPLTVWLRVHDIAPAAGIREYDIVKIFTHR